MKMPPLPAVALMVPAPEDWVLIASASVPTLVVPLVVSPAFSAMVLAEVRSEAPAASSMMLPRCAVTVSVPAPASMARSSAPPVPVPAAVATVMPTVPPPDVIVPAVCSNFSAPVASLLSVSAASVTLPPALVRSAPRDSAPNDVTSTAALFVVIAPSVSAPRPSKNIPEPEALRLPTTTLAGGVDAN